MKKWGRILLLCLVAVPLLASSALAGAAASKVETVYVDTDESGAPQGAVVSVWLQNPDKAESLQDITDLEHLQMVTGNAPVQDGQHLTFAAEGGDVLYQGTTDKALPVGVDIAFTLNGKAIEGKDVVGATGDLELSVRYVNHSAQEVAIGEGTETLYTPFTLVSLLTLDSQTATDVTVQNARVLPQGDATLVVGYGFPGLQQSLGMDAEDLDVPSGFTLRAHVEDFQMDAITTVALLGLLDAEDLSDVDTLADQLQTLSDSTQDLVLGADGLRTGAQSLRRGVSSYVSGVDQYTGGVDQLLREGVTGLDGALTPLEEGVTGIQDGAGLLRQGVDTLQGKLGPMSSAAPDLQKAADALELLAENSDLLALLGSVTEAQWGMLAGFIGQDRVDALRQALQQAGESGLDKAALQQSAQALRDAASSLEALDGGLKDLSSGVTDVQDGAGQMKDGVGQLRDAVGQIQSAADTLQANQPALNQGGLDLKHGAQSLAAGMGEFYEGLSTLKRETLDEMTGALQLEGLPERKDALLRLAEGYQTFTQLPEGMEGSVKFLFQTPAFRPEAQLSPSATAQPTAADAADDAPNVFQRAWRWVLGLFE